MGRWEDSITGLELTFSGSIEAVDDPNREERQPTATQLRECSPFCLYILPDTVLSVYKEKLHLTKVVSDAEHGVFRLLPLLRDLTFRDRRLRDIIIRGDTVIGDHSAPEERMRCRR